MNGNLWILNSMLLGVGLAMDAFSVSLANGLNEPKMGPGRMSVIAGVFGGFQTLMPLIGWVTVHSLMSVLQTSLKLVHIIAFVLLLVIGGKMLLEGLRNKESETKAAVGTGGLILQGIATSLDALSVGFTIAELSAARALASSLIIGAVTFVICMAGLALGRRFGTKLGNKAAILGGVILIAIGIEILLTH